MEKTLSLMFLGILLNCMWFDLLIVAEVINVWKSLLSSIVSCPLLIPVFKINTKRNKYVMRDFIPYGKETKNRTGIL
jgi:hypothetical protein